MLEIHFKPLRVNRKHLAQLFSKVHISTEYFYKGDPCWEWTGSLRGGGYARTTMEYRGYAGHIIMYQLFVGQIPDGLVLDHLCRVRHCVNPAHLEPVTSRVNIHRGEGFAGKNARKTHCLNGHPLSGDNLLKSANSRVCRVCRNAWGRVYDKRRNTPERRAKQREYNRACYHRKRERELKQPT